MSIIPMSKQTKMRHGCQRIKSRNYIVTNSLPSLDPLTKFPFSLTNESGTNFNLRAFELFWLSTLQTNSFLFKVSRPNEAFRGHLGPWTECFKIHGFSPREYSPLYKPSRCVPSQRVWFLHLFVLKTVRTWRTGAHPYQEPPRAPPLQGFQSLLGGK